MPKATDSQVDLILKYYPDDQRAGSPFDTGIKNALSKMLYCPLMPVVILMR